jgi:hypothetical protein
MIGDSASFAVKAKLPTPWPDVIPGLTGQTLRRARDHAPLGIALARFRREGQGRSARGKYR